MSLSWNSLYSVILFYLPLTFIKDPVWMASTGNQAMLDLYNSFQREEALSFFSDHEKRRNDKYFKLIIIWLAKASAIYKIYQIFSCFWYTMKLTKTRHILYYKIVQLCQSSAFPSSISLGTLH